MAGRLWTGNLDRVVLFSFHVWPDPSMIVYRESERVVPTCHVLREAVDGLRPLTRGLTCDHAAVTDALIRFGTLEAALADALSPEIDGLSSAIEAARSASLALGRLFRCSARREAEAVPGAARRALAWVEALAGRPLPKTARLRGPEGFGYSAPYS